MINLILSGGLGNQMFQYAYARALSEYFNDPKIVINPYFNRLYSIQMKMIKGCPDYLKCQLDLFRLNENIDETSAFFGYLRGIREIIPGAFVRFGIFNPGTSAEKFKQKTYKGKFKMLEKEFTYYEHNIECTSQKKMVLGWFQSEKYFANIRSILLQEFQFKDPASPQNQAMIDELSSCNSVCVHIRRGDLLNPFFAYVGMCNEQYYKQGMKYIAERTESPVFYIFSNNHSDIEWIKNNFQWDYPVKYVDMNNPGHEDMRLMYNCKHFVISKSTFSWWGSYMSQNRDKIVVAPDMELGNTWLKDENNSDFFRSDMIKIKTDKTNQNAFKTEIKQ